MVTDATENTALGLQNPDRTKPSITLIYPLPGALLSTATPMIQWTVTDSGSGIDTATISLTIDNRAPITVGITRTAITNGYACTHIVSVALSEGNHILRFNVRDNNGNSADQVSLSVRVDLARPALTVTKPLDGLITNQQNLEVSGVSTDSSMPVVVTVAVNDKDPTELDISDGIFSGLVSLEKGENLLTFVSTDAVGRTTTVSRTVTLDTVAPSITSSSICMTVTTTDIRESFSMQNDVNARLLPESIMARVEKCEVQD